MAEKKEQNSEIAIIHRDLENLITEIRKCNKFMDIFFTANGVYEQAAEELLLRQLSETGKKVQPFYQGSIM